MPLYNRERDFSALTLDAMRDSLKGETEDYTEFKRFLDEHADAFYDTSFASDLLEMDRYITNLRYFNEAALKELDRIARNIYEVDERFASQCRETAEEFTRYNHVLLKLNSILSNDQFVHFFAINPKNDIVQDFGHYLGKKAREWLEEQLRKRGLKEAEIIAALNDPAGASSADDCRNIANSVYPIIIQIGGTPAKTDGRQVNSFHHAFWNALMTYNIGSKRAKEFADAHEEPNPPVNWNKIVDGFPLRWHKAMDLHNNNIGRTIGEKCPKNGRAIYADLLARCGTQEEINARAEFYGVTIGYPLLLLLMCMDAYKEAVACRIDEHGRLVSVPRGTDISGRLVFLSENYAVKGDE